jgi:acyl-ACP thioesterase
VSGGTELVPLPEIGRRFTTGRKVRLGDAAIDGRLRLDALARMLQDVANDDARDALGDDASSWVVRRMFVDVRVWPRFGEALAFTTFLGGVGGRWAERRTTVQSRRGAHVECAALWVHVDLATGRPAPLPASFLPMYGQVYGSRKVSGRLTLPGVSPDATREPWAVRAVDFDILGHVNNAAYWAPVEEALATVGPARLAPAALDVAPVDVAPLDVARLDVAPLGPARFELEYKLAIEPHHAVDLARDGDLLWLVAPDTTDVHAAARLIV